MKTININIPQEWNSLSDQSIQKIACLFHNEEPSASFYYKLMYAVLNLRWWHLKRQYNLYKLFKNVALSELLKHLSFLTNTASLTRFLPELNINNKKYFSPGKRLHNISAAQFAFCEDLFFYYNQTKDIEYLRYIAAALYLASKESFNKDTIENKLEVFSEVSDDFLLSLALSYKGSTLEIQKLYPKIFKKTTAGKTSLKESKPKAPGFEEIIVLVTKESDLFSNLKQTESTNVHVFLKEFTRLLKKKTNEK